MTDAMLFFYLLTGHPINRVVHDENNGGCKVYTKVTLFGLVDPILSLVDIVYLHLYYHLDILLE